MSHRWYEDDWPDDDGQDVEPFGDGDDRGAFSLDDEMLADRAAAALRQDERIRGRRIELTVQNRVIILIGDVATAEASDAAGRLAWSVPGVHDVCNRLSVAGSNGPVVWDWPR